METPLQTPALVGPVAWSNETTTIVPFSVIDQAVHLLDVPTAPWSIQLEVKVAGELDIARLRAAFFEALQRHEMARVRKLPTRLNAPLDRWAVTEAPEIDPLRVVDCPDDGALRAVRIALQDRSVPLTESPPLRAILARHPGGDCLMLNLSHAAMDGFGSLRVLRSIAREYTGEPDPLLDIDLEQARNLATQLATPAISVLLGRQLVLASRLRDVMAPPARIARDGATYQPGYGFVHRSLSNAETEALISATGRFRLLGPRSSAPAGPSETTARRRRSAKPVHPTVNDLLVSALHLTIADWDTQHGVACRRIGVLVPANLRPPAWREEVVGNYSLPARISTTRRSRRSPAETVAAVARQTAHKKRYGFGTALLDLLCRSRVLPLWAKRMVVLGLPLTGNRLVDTAMLSNVGRLDDLSFGSASVEELWFSPPARMPLGLAIGTATMNGKLFVVLRYRHRQFDEAAATRFADVYLDRLLALCGSVESAG